ncbi:MAG TPA: glycosyltransferase [Ilumatobacteraceae bacterium]|jgi:glycosyltransferase involved in cell wall biosynthesis
MARFSVVVSALDEQADLDRSLRAINRAAHAIHVDAEIVVVVLDHESAFGRLAAASGAKVVKAHRSSIAVARNAGAWVATGQILVTIDADRVMSPVAFAEIERLLATGCYVGGGAMQQPERHTLAIDVAMVMSKLTTYLNGLGGGMYWCRREDFDAIGGFDERVTAVDDLDFARRLRDHGLRTGRRFVNLRQAPVTTSCRRGSGGRFSYALTR